MAFVKIILLPLSIIYGVVTGVRNFLFHKIGRAHV